MKNNTIDVWNEFMKDIKSGPIEPLNQFKDYYSKPIPTHHPVTGEFTGNTTLEEMIGDTKLVKRKK